MRQKGPTSEAKVCSAVPWRRALFCASGTLSPKC
jgi:hypothetical protein